MLGYLGGLYDPIQKSNLINTDYISNCLLLVIQVVRAYPLCYSPNDSSEGNASAEADVSHTHLE